MKRSVILTVALMLALAGAVFGSVATAPAPAPAGNVTAVDVSKTAPIDCYSEQEYDYEESYQDAETGEYVTLYQVFERKCFDSGWDGSQQCGEWHFVYYDEVRTGGDDWNLGD